MENIEMKVSDDGKKLTIIVDLTVEGHPSSTGKSTVIATTRGNATVPGTDFKLGLNLFKKR